MFIYKSVIQSGKNLSLKENFMRIPRLQKLIEKHSILTIAFLRNNELIDQFAFIEKYFGK